MPAYVIIETDVSDEAPMAEYRKKVPALIARHGGKYIVRGAPTARLEGDRDLPDTVVVLEFPTLEHVAAWHDDPDYAPFIALRQSGAHSEMILVEGV